MKIYVVEIAHNLPLASITLETSLNTASKLCLGFLNINR